MTSSEETDKREVWSEKSRRSKPVRDTSLFIFIYSFSGFPMSEMLIKLQNLMNFYFVFWMFLLPCMCYHLVSSFAQHSGCDDGWQYLHLYHIALLHLYPPA